MSKYAHSYIKLLLVSYRLPPRALDSLLAKINYYLDIRRETCLRRVPEAIFGAYGRRFVYKFDSLAAIIAHL